MCNIGTSTMMEGESVAWTRGKLASGAGYGGGSVRISQDDRLLGGILLEVYFWSQIYSITKVFYIKVSMPLDLLHYGLLLDDERVRNPDTLQDLEAVVLDEDVECQDSESNFES